MQLLVARTGGAQRELLDAVAREARVRVAVDEAGDRAVAAPVELDDVAVERGQIPHPPDRRDHAVLAEHVRVVEPVDVRERASTERRVATGRRDELLEVADQQARRAGLAHAVPAPPIGASKPCSAAAAAASG